MLKILGVIYYILAALLLVVMLDRLLSSGVFATNVALVAGIGALATAFFGAMCFVADDCRTLLAKIAGEQPKQFSWYPTESKQLRTEVGRESEVAEVRSRTCPQCGTRYAGDTSFCTSDGVALV